MDAAAVVTLLAVGLIVLALAGYLIAVTMVLTHVHRQLNAIIATIQRIAQQVEPVNPIVNEINQDLAGIDNALKGLLAAPTTSASASRSRRRIS